MLIKSTKLLIAALLASLLQLSHLAFPADDLLDPDKIGKSRKSMQSDTLLDPTQIKASSSNATSKSGSSRRSQRQEPIYARDMANSVTGSLDSLTNAAMGLIKEAKKLEADIQRLESKLRELKEEKESKLEEYRKGLFCSGCNKTKSEILAKGEQFPHPGQSIIRPTAKQIAKKERELQAPIDHTERDLDPKRTRYAKAVSERDEALQQILHGLNLWRTSINLENLLITMDEDDRIAAYKAERTQVEEQINKLDSEIFQEKMVVNSIPGLISEKAKLEARLKQLEKGSAANAKERARVKNQLEQIVEKIKKKQDSKANLEALTREKETWTATLDKLDQQRSKTKQAYLNALARATARVGEEQATLENYMNRVRSSTILIPSVDASPVSTLADFDALGGKYRLGDYDPGNVNKVLPRVEKFVNAYLSTNRKPMQDVPERIKEKSAVDSAPKKSKKGKLDGLLD